nr:vitellogenin 4 [Macrobrachium rosenbergii]
MFLSLGTYLLLLSISSLSDATVSGPLEFPLCSEECPVTGSPKLSYKTGQTYLYLYTGKSQVLLQDVNGAVAETSWKAEVSLSWLSPCDVAISVKNPVIDGGASHPSASSIERYALVVAIYDGQVQHVCSHTDEDTWSLNFKKGIASVFQNSLPTLSPVNTGLQFTEIDVVGNCATEYSVRNRLQKTFVTKEKDHRRCRDHYLTRAGNPVAWLQGSLPVEESKSTCEQVIVGNIYIKITCSDKKTIRPLYGSYKYIEAQLGSDFILRSTDAPVPSSLVNLRGNILEGSLLYDHKTPKKDPSLIPHLDDILSQICSISGSLVQHDTAGLVSQAIFYLKQVPDSAIPAVLNKIRHGDYCSHFKHLENIFLDAIAFVFESGAVRVMVDELVSKEVSKGRHALYIAALHLTHRPNLEAVNAVMSLFNGTKSLPQTTLAAASLVNNYCRLHQNCEREAPIQEILEILGDKIERDCEYTSDDDAQEAALANLKALGNFGIIDTHYARVIIRCLERVEANTDVRIAAAEAFRNAKCQKEATTQLSSIAVDSDINTEVRIASYLQAVRCADENDLLMMIEKMTKETSTQVRSFIITHLLKIQTSRSSRYENQWRILRDVVIPTNFTSDFRKYSRNNEFSYYSPLLNAGLNIDSNLIYDTASYFPRSVGVNVTADIGGTSLNLGEFGARIKGIEPTLESWFGPDGYFRKTSSGGILHDVSTFARDEGRRIIEELEDAIRRRRSIDYSTILLFLEKLYGGPKAKVPQLDTFARFMGQEICYSSVKGKVYDVDTDRMVESLLDLARKLIDEIRNMNIDTTHAAQIRFDYSLPTIHGVPLKLEIEGTAVVGLKVSGKIVLHNLLSYMRHSKATLAIAPSISGTLEAFIGYDSYFAKEGLKFAASMYSKEDISLVLQTTPEGELELGLDFPEKTELMSFENEIYLMKAIRGIPEEKVIPSSLKDIRTEVNSCSQYLEPILGIKICYAINAPNILLAEGFPLGQKSSVKLSVEKTDSSMTGYHMKAHVKNTHGEKTVLLLLRVCNFLPVKESKAKLEYLLARGRRRLSAAIESPRMESSFSVQAENQEDEKEIDVVISYKVDESEAHRRVKIISHTSGNIVEKRIDVKVFFSPTLNMTSASLVAETRFYWRSSGLTEAVEIVAKTSDVLKEQIIIDFESSSDWTFRPRRAIPLEVTPHKFELQVALKGWKLVSFIRKPKGFTYESSLKLTKLRDEILLLSGTHEVKGSLDSLFTFKTALKAKVRSELYKASIDILNENIQSGIAINVMHPTTQNKICVIDLMSGRIGETSTSTILVDIPSYLKPIHLENTFTSQRANELEIKSSLRHGKHLLLEISGPLSFSASLHALSFEGNLNITTLTAGPYNVYVAVTFSQVSQLISVDVRSRITKVFALNWNTDAEYPNNIVYGIELFVPTLIDNEFYLIISASHVTILLNNQWFPNTPYPRRMKGLGDLNVANKTLSADFSWDADRYPNKKLSLDLALVIDPSDSEQTTISGDIKFLGKRYQVKLTDSVDGDEGSESTERSTGISLTLPTRKTIVTRVDFKVEQLASSIKLETVISLTTLAKKHYNMKGMLHIQNPHSSSAFKIATEVKFIPPDSHETKCFIEAVHSLKPGGREIFLKVKASNHAIHNPLIMEMVLHNEAHSSKMDFTVETDRKNSVLTWDLQFYPGTRIRNVNIVMRLDSVVDLLRTIREMTDTGLHIDGRDVTSLLRMTAEPLVYRVGYNKSAPHFHAVWFHSPFQAMEAEMSFSPDEYSFKFYPERERRDVRYEVSSLHMSSWNETHSQWQGCLSHPHLSKDIKVTANYKKGGKIRLGTLEVDIFPDIADKISGSVESLQLSENSHQHEAMITTRVLTEHPKVKVITANSQQMKGLDVSFNLRPVALTTALKYRATPEENAAFSFYLKAGGRVNADVTGSLKPLKSYNCEGLLITAVADIPVIGKHDIQTIVCQRAYVEMSVKVHGENGSVYKATMGLQDPNNLEFGMFEKSVNSSEHPVALLQSRLTTPSLISFDYVFKYPEAYRLWNSACTKLSKVRQGVRWHFLRIYAYLFLEAEQKKISFPPPKMVVLYKEAVQEITKIYQDIVRDGLIQRYKDFLQLLKSPREIYVKNILKWTWSHIEGLRRIMENYMLTEILAWKTEFKEVADFLAKGIQDMADLVEKGEVPEDIKRLLKDFETRYLVQAIKNELRAFASLHPEEYRGFQQILSKTEAVLYADLVKLQKHLLAIPSTQTLLKWIHGNDGHWTERAAKTFVARLIQQLTFFSLDVRNNEARLQLPLSKPVYSLSQLAQRASLSELLQSIVFSYYVAIPPTLSELIWAYYNFLPHQVSDLLPPFNRTAMIVGDTELLTFDGAVLHLPRSECEVLLVSYPLNELTMEFPEEDKPPQFTMTVSGTKVVVKPDQEVFINGRLVTHNHYTEGPISVSRTHLEVAISSQSLSLHVFRTSRMASLEISGWAFGRVGGLFGTYDGEVGNDWMMPSGAMATSMQQLVSSWQENQACETPNIAAVNPSFSRMVRCNAMLNIRSRCSSVVKPDLFVKMCYAGYDACDAARAYRTLCAERGVLALVPMGC